MPSHIPRSPIASTASNEPQAKKQPSADFLPVSEPSPPQDFMLLTPSRIMQMQKIHGNQAVMKLLGNRDMNFTKPPGKADPHHSLSSAKPTLQAKGMQIGDKAGLLGKSAGQQPSDPNPVIQRKWVEFDQGPEYGLIRWEQSEDDDKFNHELKDGWYKASLNFRKYWAKLLSEDEVKAIRTGGGGEPITPEVVGDVKESGQAIEGAGDVKESGLGVGSAGEAKESKLEANESKTGGKLEEALGLVSQIEELVNEVLALVDPDSDEFANTQAILYHSINDRRDLQRGDLSTPNAARMRVIGYLRSVRLSFSADVKHQGRGKIGPKDIRNVMSEADKERKTPVSDKWFIADKARKTKGLSPSSLSAEQLAHNFNRLTPDAATFGSEDWVKHAGTIADLKGEAVSEGTGIEADAKSTYDHRAHIVPRSAINMLVNSMSDDQLERVMAGLAHIAKTYPDILSAAALAGGGSAKESVATAIKSVRANISIKQKSAKDKDIFDPVKDEEGNPDDRSILLEPIYNLAQMILVRRAMELPLSEAKESFPIVLDGEVRVIIECLIRAAAACSKSTAGGGLSDE